MNYKRSRRSTFHKNCLRIIHIMILKSLSEKKDNKMMILSNKPYHYLFKFWGIFLLTSLAVPSECRVTNSTVPINFHYLPGIDDVLYSQPGDINIGALVHVYSNGKPFAERCSANVRRNTIPPETTEGIAFAVDSINRNPAILPNVSLGFVMRGVCASRNVALATSLLFLPRAQRVCNGTACYSSQMTSPLSESPWLSYDVIGVLGSGYSSVSLSISTLYAVASLPLLGLEETSDDFSNKRDHPSFFRMGPPDVYQVHAILQFVSENGWSYISVVYAEGNYGENAFKNVERNIGSYGICIATSHIILHNTNYEEVVENLLRYSRSRTVVLFLTGLRFRKLLGAAINLNVTGHFIWIGSDSMNTYRGYNNYPGESNLREDEDPAIGGFSLNHYTTYINKFYHHLRQQSLDTTSNPWLKTPYEYLLDCSFDDNTCDPDADIFQSSKFRAGKAAPMRIDAVLTLAQAAHNLLSERCPNARGEEARACITRKLFHEYLKNVDLEGYNGRIRFDEKQDVKGKYLIGQFKFDYFDYPFTNRTEWKDLTKKSVGIYDTSTKSITYSQEPVTWSHLNTLDRVVPWTDGSLSIAVVPESVCSRPCLVGEYKIEKDVPCCWECRTCRENERLVDGNTSCEACPSFMWPDPSSDFTTCVDIPPSYPRFDDTLPIVLNALAFLFLTINTIIIALYISYRNERVIKASSKELSVLQLVAIFAGYLTIVLFQTKPTDIMCGAIFFLFCMSFSLLYCSLLVKAVRIYRIFQSGAKNEKPRFISPKSQLIFSVCLIAVQVALCVATYIVFWPRARLTQPIWSEKMVEISCDLTFPGLVSFLGYNIVLVSACSVLAFMTRKLPDNFNESKFISMCVLTTLLIWLAFVPTYFTADRQFIRVFLLSMALLLNHSVALLLLFAPKIYAAIFVPSDSGNFSKAKS